MCAASLAARPAQALGAHNLACDNGTARILHELAGELCGRIQSFAMRYWYLQDLAQDSPGNCARDQQLGTNLLRWMASLIIAVAAQLQFAAEAYNGYHMTAYLDGRLGC